MWFVLNTKYYRASIIIEELKKLNLNTFHTNQISNMLFVEGEKKEIDNFIYYNQVGQKVGYMYSTITKMPLVIPEKEMKMFIIICQSEFPIILTDRKNLKLGDRVRVIGGPFKGVEGHIVRIKKQKRVLVDLNVVAAETSYILPELLEVIPS